MTYTRIASMVLAVFAGAHTCPAASALPTCTQFTLSGKVHGATVYERALGMDMTFTMFPDDRGTGWTYRIGPAKPPLGEWDNYVAITPPYHFGDASDIGPGWGTLAQELAGPRLWVFWFLASRKQSEAASVALANYIRPDTDVALNKAAAAVLDTFDIGEGRFTIRRSRIRNGTATRDDTSGTGDYGAVLAIVFSVELVFPAAFRVNPALKPVRVSCPMSGRWHQD